MTSTASNSTQTKTVSKLSIRNNRQTSPPPPTHPPTHVQIMLTVDSPCSLNDNQPKHSIKQFVKNTNEYNNLSDHTLCRDIIFSAGSSTILPQTNTKYMKYSMSGKFTHTTEKSKQEQKQNCNSGNQAWSKQPPTTVSSIVSNHFEVHLQEKASSNKPSSNKPGRGNCL